MQFEIDTSLTDNALRKKLFLNEETPDFAGVSCEFTHIKSSLMNRERLS